MTEAAQSRLTAISGARDDFDPGDYRARIALDLLPFVRAEPSARAPAAAAAIEPADYIGHIASRLKAVGVGSAIVAPLEAGERGFAVAKALVSGSRDGSRRAPLSARPSRFARQAGAPMKALFAGPSLYGDIVAGRIAAAPEIVCRGPAAQGDLAAAVLDGATAIGLVDGRYEDVAAPWHKEILFALSEGVAVYGGGSLGALRAVECAPFGMIGVGEIFARYMSGDLVDDSAVAQLHAPAELDYMPLTEALVNVEATIRRLAARGIVDAALAAALAASARALFFKRLTYRRWSNAPARRRRRSPSSPTIASIRSGRTPWRWSRECRRRTTPSRRSRPGSWRGRSRGAGNSNGWSRRAAAERGEGPRANSRRRLRGRSKGRLSRAAATCAQSSAAAAAALDRSRVLASRAAASVISASTIDAYSPARQASATRWTISAGQKPPAPSASATAQQASATTKTR